MSFSAASDFFKPAIFSSFSCWRVRISRISPFSSSTSSSCLRCFSARLSSWSILLSSDVSRSASRDSVFFHSLRRSFSRLSASSFAFRTISPAFIFAEAISFSALFFPSATRRFHRQPSHQHQKLPQQLRQLIPLSWLFLSRRQLIHPSKLYLL
jgi:hypothetical protein